MSYLIDTDWVVEYLKGREPVVTVLPQLRHEGLAISHFRSRFDIWSNEEFFRLVSCIPIVKYNFKPPTTASATS